jgi:hypothetical protein
VSGSLSEGNLRDLNVVFVCQERVCETYCSMSLHLLVLTFVA